MFCRRSHRNGKRPHEVKARVMAERGRLAFSGASLFGIGRVNLPKADGPQTLIHTRLSLCLRPVFP